MSALKQPACHDDLLNYRLKHLVAIGGAPAVRLCEGGYGVSRLQWRLVAKLVEDGAMTLGELVARSRIESARGSRAVRDLEHKGLVARTPDGRRARLAATGRGEALYRSLLPRLAEINRRIMEPLTEEEALQLEDFLQRLTRQAEAIAREGGGVEVKTGRHLGSGRRRPAYFEDARGIA